MRNRKRPFKYLLFSIFFLLAIIYIVIFFPPTYQFLGQEPISFWLKISNVFLLPVFLFFFSISTYIFKNKMQGFLIGLFVLSFLLMRMNNLNHPFFFILLVALFLTLWLLFTYRK